MKFTPLEIKYLCQLFKTAYDSNMRDIWVQMVEDIFNVVNILGEKLTPYQIDALWDRSRKIILRWSRQSGKTTITALKVLCEILLAYPNKIWIGCIAPILRQSKFVYNKMQTFLKNSIFRDPDSKQTGVCKSVLTKMTLSETIFAWGPVVMVMPGKNVRGPTFDILTVDEDQGVIDQTWTALNPALKVKRAKEFVLGTPLGRHNHFHRACTNRDLGYNEHYVNYLMVPYLPHDEIRRDLETGAMSQNAWNREWMAIFVAVEGAAFDPDLVEKAAEEYEMFDLDEVLREGKLVGLEGLV